MSDYLSQLLKSGKTLLKDTKLPATKEKREVVAKSSSQPTTPADSDPHKVFIKKTVSDKPKKLEVVESLKRFITAEESKL
jgi:hypothetical protein